MNPIDVNYFFSSSTFKLFHNNKSRRKAGAVRCPLLGGAGGGFISSLLLSPHLPSPATPSYNPSEIPLRNTATGYSDLLK